MDQAKREANEQRDLAVMNEKIEELESAHETFVEVQEAKIQFHEEETERQITLLEASHADEVEKDELDDLEAVNSKDKKIANIKSGNHNGSIQRQ